jgi:hypothetical protein
MKFAIYGPYEIPRSNGLVETAAASKNKFWADVGASVTGLPDACGCYVFAVKARRGTLPWYVGLTTKRTFRDEALGYYQVIQYGQALGRKVGVKPMLFLLAKETPKGRFAKPSRNSHKDVEFLERFMFALALNRNPKLRNTKNTRFLKKLVVPGVINSPRRPPKGSERELKAVLGSNK